MSTPPRSRQERVEVVRQRSSAGLGWIRAKVAGAGLFRASSGGIVAGVLAGLARRFGVSPWVLRGAFIVSMLLPGPQFLLYLVLWVITPREP